MHRKTPLSSSGSLGQPTLVLDIPAELVPVVTLLSSQGHRRYIELLFLLLHDLTNDGLPGPRTWTEVYGVLSGYQLAMWDAALLLKARSQGAGHFSNASKKLEYLNLADAQYQAQPSLPSSLGKPLENVLIVRTTAKNRYILSFLSVALLNDWHLAVRLAAFEYSALQEAYTGALLLARGSKMLDIRVILAESKYNYEHWVLIKFGAGGNYRKCYVVIEPLVKKKKGKLGRILIYEHDKVKKAPLLAEIISARAAYAVYPNAPKMIDASTLIKIEGQVVYGLKKSKSAPEDTAVFIMPDAHMLVPGYDTLIRFLVPALDALRLYGRPSKLNADKRDPSLLLFGLPVLPFVHYLELEDAKKLGGPALYSWTVSDWDRQLREVLRSKMQNGYMGCGLAHGLDGAINLPALGAPGSELPLRANFTPSRERLDAKRSSGTSSTFGPISGLAAGGSSSSLVSGPGSGLGSSYGTGPSMGPAGMSNSSFGSGPMPSSNPNKQLPLPLDRSGGLSAPAAVGPGISNIPSGLPKKNDLPLPSDLRPNGLKYNTSEPFYGQNGPRGPSPGPPSGPPSGPTPYGQLPSLNSHSKFGNQQNNPYNRSPKPLAQNYSPHNYPANKQLDLQIPNNDQKRMLEITQIYTDYAKIPSPKDNNLSLALEKLNITKEVDDSEFDLDSILLQTREEEKRRSKKEIDIFNPAYSEALLSPAVENNINPFENPNSAPTSARPKPRQLQPTLPQISVDDDEPDPYASLLNLGLRVQTNGPSGPRAYPSY